MGSDEFHKHNAGSESDCNDKAKPIAADIEHDTSVSNPIGASRVRLDIRKTLPLRTSAFNNPLTQRRSSGRMQRPEVAKVFDFYYAHATVILQLFLACVNPKLNKMISSIYLPATTIEPFMWQTLLEGLDDRKMKSWSKST